MDSRNTSTINGWLQNNNLKLSNAGIESARLDCLVLLEHVLKKNRSWILAHGDEVLDVNTIASLNSLLDQREKRVPLAYIVSSKEFYGRKFKVTKEVLIPRPESEAIIELLLEKYGNEKLSAVATKNNWNLNQVENDNPLLSTPPSPLNTIIDIGTGSGILAITAKLELPQLHVIATDISISALQIARKNALLLGAKVQFKLQDFIKDGLPKMPKTRPYVIVANLPYVPKDLITSPEILKEPSKALFSENDGMDHYRKFWEQISLLKNKPEAVITEALDTQHETMYSFAAAAGFKLEKTTDLIQLFKP